MKTKLLAVAVLLASFGQAQAIVLDDQLYISYEMVLDGSTYVQDWSNVTVTDAVELEGFGGVVDIDVSNASPDLRFDFSDILFFSMFSSVEFNGFTIVDTTGTVEDFGAVTIESSNLAGFDATRIFSTNDMIYLNFAGLAFTSDTFINFDIAPTSAPEPGTMLLFGLGLVGLVSVKGKKKFN